MLIRMKRSIVIALRRIEVELMKSLILTLEIANMAMWLWSYEVDEDESEMG